MAPASKDQLAALKARIDALSLTSLRVDEVEAEDVEGPEGASVLVTVTLRSSDATSEWNSQDFLTLRREARTAAVAELGDQSVRLVYEDADSSDIADDDAVDTGDKTSSDGVE